MPSLSGRHQRIRRSLLRRPLVPRHRAARSQASRWFSSAPSAAESRSGRDGGRLRDLVARGSAVLQLSQRELQRKRGAIWGRVLTMQALCVPAPRLRGFSLWANWLRIPRPDQWRSVLGTVRRVFTRRYHRALQPRRSRIPCDPNWAERITCKTSQRSSIACPARRGCGLGLWSRQDDSRNAQRCSPRAELSRTGSFTRLPPELQPPSKPIRSARTSRLRRCLPTEARRRLPGFRRTARWQRLRAAESHFSNRENGGHVRAIQMPIDHSRHLRLYLS